MKNKAKVGVLALGRTTFDVPYAQEMLAQAWQTLSGMDIELVGNRYCSLMPNRLCKYCLHSNRPISICC